MKRWDNLYSYTTWFLLCSFIYFFFRFWKVTGRKKKYLKDTSQKLRLMHWNSILLLKCLFVFILLIFVCWYICRGVCRYVICLFVCLCFTFFEVYSFNFLLQFTLRIFVIYSQIQLYGNSRKVSLYETFRRFKRINFIYKRPLCSILISSSSPTISFIIIII